MSEQKNSKQFRIENPITQDLNFQVQDLGDGDARATVVCLESGLVTWTRFFSHKSRVNSFKAAQIAWEVLRRDGSTEQVDHFIALEATEA